MPAPKAGELDAIKIQLQTLDSKVNLITQKIKTMDKNAEIVGRTILGYNDRLKEVEQKGGGQSFAGGGDTGELEKRIDALEKELKELRYVIDTINPLEFAKIDDVKDLIKEKIGK